MTHSTTKQYHTLKHHLVSHHQCSLPASSLYVTLIPSSVRSRYMRRVKNGWTVRSLAPMRIITDNPYNRHINNKHTPTLDDLPLDVVIVMTSLSGISYTRGWKCPKEMRNSIRLWIRRDPSLGTWRSQPISASIGCDVMFKIRWIQMRMRTCCAIKIIGYFSYCDST